MFEMWWWLHSKVERDTYPLKLAIVSINVMSLSAIAKLHMYIARLSRRQRRKCGEHHGGETTASPQPETFDRPELVLFRLFRHEHEAISPVYHQRGAMMLIREGDPRQTLRS
jgi:hypothetical protein